MNQYVFFWSSTEKFEKKSLLPEFKDYQSKYFVIMKQSNLIKLSKMKVMPWFGMPGDGEKYFFSSNNTYLPLDRLFKAGHLKYIKLLNKKHHIFYDLNNIYAVLDDKYKVEFPDKEIALNQAILNDSINLFQIAK